MAVMIWRFKCKTGPRQRHRLKKSAFFSFFRELKERREPKVTAISGDVPWWMR